MVRENGIYSVMENYDGSGHEVNIDAPEKLAELLRNFYNRKS